MAAIIDRTPQRTLNPVHAVLLAAIVPLFLGALLSDVAYSNSYEVQWTNFASWLIVGGLIFSGSALLWALIDLIRADRRSGRTGVLFLLLLAAFVLGFFNALVHAKDAWASQPAGLILSMIIFVLAIIATWVGFARPREEDNK